MDAVDRRIIAALRDNGRATYAELGRQVGLSASAVHERVGKLESSGVITGYHAMVDPSAVGLGVTALVGIQPTDTGDDDEVAAALAELPEVESCYAVAGDEAFVVKVRVATVDELERALGRLRRIDGVARTRTTVVLSTRFEGRPNTPGSVGEPPVTSATQPGA
ncbi:Lrp/AsnC family transcriptional regulator [Allokutzneria oryzae]|uniref:Lrp/AsnC family transcriptional regulator n=1 Tax=Allokutzneria oryzae TaxID=1378989 RepID=A0ABV5ZWF3_9PSEU